MPPQALTGEALLRVWERGARRHPFDQALAILASAGPAEPPARLAALSIGQRDAALLAARAATFGPTMRTCVACPACGERLEFEMDVDRLGIDQESALGDPTPDAIGTFAVDGYAIEFRLPDSHDLAAIADCGDLATARRLLVGRCLVRAEREGAAIGGDDLPDGVVAELGRQIVARDPQAEIVLDLACPACEARWAAPFDIVTFFWAELTAAATRLLREVHALARGYGWREADLLAMTPWRRRRYLDLLEP